MTTRFESLAYGEAFAFWAPIMRDRWARAPAAQRAGARRDVEETLRLHAGMTPYVAKLYAELDAIRDAEMADRRAR